ncbi:MAG: methionyl-tRNA formyltransferase [Bacteroidales bacterium]|jgi:methionyl-tRNA formyltransferase|nr:methionyl-tRNA formyltransferase [Bacteroidales bacterium]MDD2824560.1 methionyl-tRNA formyltransferase [Bacteroidales bacterium]MDD3099985.1 methionyl-tRNA formyltransferase [Bacteroidales bacterium]MDD3638735.1 methionyl-tRNA formyltransferase [Bacteroidales bacterium]MDD3943486.1 methionyl-tRNA formyltransferase [Bacteroidales bacterium]
MTKKTDRPGIVFMGTPGFAAGILSWLIQNGYPVRGVVTVPDKPAGRGLATRPSAVKQTALENGIPVLQPVSLKETAFLEALSAWDAPLFVVVAFRMLPREVWTMPPSGCFNLHASLLPRYRGAAPINHVLINGEKETGLTTFLIDEHMDTGAILLRERIPIADGDNAGTLHDRMMTAAGPLVAKTIDGLWSGTLRATAQPQVAPEDLKPAPKIGRETCRIDWDRDPVRIVNQVRGLSPYPCAFCTLRKSGVLVDVKVFQAQAEYADHSLTPGSIRTDGKKVLKVACRDGFVQLLEVQAAGKKRLNAAAFLAGFRDPGDSVFI